MLDELLRAKKRTKLCRTAFVVFVLAAIGEIGRRSAPAIGRELELSLTRREIEAGQLNEAETRLDQFISENPRDTRPRLALVQVYRRQGRITEAEETLQRAVEMGLPLAEASGEHRLLRKITDPLHENPVSALPKSRF